MYITKGIMEKIQKELKITTDRTFDKGQVEEILTRIFNDDKMMKSRFLDTEEAAIKIKFKLNDNYTIEDFDREFYFVDWVRMNKRFQSTVMKKILKCVISVSVEHVCSHREDLNIHQIMAYANLDMRAFSILEAYGVKDYKSMCKFISCNRLKIAYKIGGTGIGLSTVESILGAKRLIDRNFDSREDDVI